MASKRKSTVPCMIPSKSKHVREEIILGSLPELLPTIPEDSILSISGEESAHFSHAASKPDGGTEVQKGGTYSCPKCRFESRDLNFFLDHMHNCHLDFRAQPTFYCLDCGVSVVRFEALALHNANAHPKIMEGVVTASLSVNKRDGVTTVEQSLFTDGADDCRESAISLTKTPIAKMMKAKGEHKRIVVSHTVEVRKIDPGKDVDPSMLTNVPELQNGALGVPAAPAVPRNAVTHVITKTVSNQVFHQHTPSLYSPPASDGNKDLPKVMIPLSSIPTYDAAMDTSSFLKTSFGKFPYPTKAELCYLTVVSEFPEEQIKLWFTAQRLKQGISWSPEEIEEARRKMFNTVFQGGAPQKQPAAQRQVNHIVSHHTVAAGARGPNFQMAKVPYANLKTRPVGVLASQPSMSTNPNVTRVSYSTPIIPPEFRTTKVLTKNPQPAPEPEKSNGLGLDMAAGSGCASSTSSSRSSSSSSSCSSSSSISSYSSSSNGGETVARKPATNGVAAVARSPGISNNDEHCVADGGAANGKSNGSPVGPEESNGAKSQAITDSTSKPNPVACNDRSSPPNQAAAAEHNHNNHTHKTNNGGEHPAATLNHASKPPTESTSTTGSPEEPRGGVRGVSILQQLIKEDEPLKRERSGPELKVNPIKLSFKRLKMNEPEPEAPHPDAAPDGAEVSAPPPQPSFSPPWSNKTPQQLLVFRQVFSNTRWPSSQQYEDLSVQTGLPKSEVVRWFSDSRYSHKNGQLKWLESFQRPAEEASGAESAARKKLVEQDVNKHLEGEAGLNSGQRVVWQDSYSPLLSLMGSDGGGERSRAEEAAPPEVLPGPWSERAEDHREPGAQADGNQARDRLRMELLEV